MILITGSEGMIGKKLIGLIPATGIDIKNGEDLLSCDLPDADVVIHLAAQTSVEASWKDPVHDMNNVRLTARIVQRYPHAKIIHTNSCASLTPKSPYGFSKRASGEYLKTFCTKYIDLVLPNIYGGQKSVVDIFKGKSKVTVYGDGKQVRDYVHIDDIVQGIIKSVHWPYGTYLMGSGTGTTVLELAEGKKIVFAPPRKEERAIVLENTTPDWEPVINVIQYINDK